MAEIVNEAVIRVTADASGVEAGLRPVEAAVTKTGKNLENLGETANKTGRRLQELGNTPGLQAAGDGADKAATKVDRSAKSMADAIQRATATMEAGRKGSVEYYRALANQRGIDVKALQPFLDQLDATTRKTEAAAEAQRKLEESTRFLSDLRTRADSIGKTASQLAEMRAAQMGVSESAAPMIARLREAEGATSGLGRMSGLVGTALKGLGAAFIAVEAAKLVKEVFSAQREFDKLNASLVTATGSTAGAAQAFAALQNFAATTPFSVQEATEAFIKMKNLGLDPSEHALRSYGNTASAMGKSLDQMVEAVADASTGEFERLKEFGIKAKANGDQISFTFQGVTASVANSASDIEGYLQKIGDTKFGGGMELRAKTLDGVISNLGDTWQSVTRTIAQNGIGTLMMEGVLAATGALSDLKAMLDAVGGSARKEGDAVKESTELHKMWTTIFETLAVLGVNTAYVFGQIGNELGGLAAQAKAVATGNFADAKRIGELMKAEAEAARKAVDAKSEAILGAAAKAQKAEEAAAAARQKGGQDALAGYKTEASAAEKAAQALSALSEVRERLAGVDKQYLEDLKKLQAARETGAIKDKEYIELVSKLAAETYKKSDAGKDATEVAKKEAEAAKGLIESIKEKIAASAAEAAGRPALAESQKLQVALDEQLLSGKLKLTAAHKAEYEALIQRLGVNEAVIASNKRAAQGAADFAKIMKEYNDASEKKIEDAIKEAEANEHLAATFGATKKAIAELEVARLEEQLAQRGAGAFTLDEIENLEKLIAAKKRSAAAMGRIDDLDGAKKASDDLDKFLDPTKAQTFGEALRTAFGSAGDALTKLTGSLQDFGIKQAEIEKQRGNAAMAYLNGKKTEEEYLANIDELNRRSTKNQLAGYGDMAGAAAGFFDEHSRGYQALMTVSQVFHAAELAMTMAELVPKAISAVLTQGQGDPYTAFGRMAAMGALVAGLGVAIGGIGGGGSTLAADRQKAAGTGSVFGDSDAKSESIKHVLDAVEKNTYQDLAINSSMLATLQSIDSNIGRFASQLVRSTDITNPDVGNLNSNNGAATTAMQFAAGGLIGIAISKAIPAVGNLVGKIATSIFGGKQSVSDSGFGMDAASLASILGNGAHAFQYADITTSGGWFGSDKSSEKSNPLSDAANQQFTGIIVSLSDSIKAAGGMLGLAGDDFTNKLNGFVVDIGHVSLKDLKGEELQKALESVFSKLGDDMAQYAVGGLQELQQVGEGYLETLVRVASEYQAIDVVFQSLGKTFGEVGLESIAARDRLVQLAGGLDKFTSQGEYFLTNFFSEKEQAAALKARIDPTLAQYGLSTAGENATKMFRDFIVCLDTTTEAGAKTYTELMAIAPAFKAVTDAQQDALDERKDLQGQLDELTMSSTQLLAKQRDALDESNRALFDQVQAIKSVKDAASTLLGGVNDAFSVLQKVTVREKSAIQSSVDAHTAAFGKLQSLSQALHGTLDSLKSPDQKAFERAGAQAQIRAALAIAKAGGPLPDSDALKNALSAVTQDASSQFSSYADYMRDLLQTQNDVAQLAGLTDDSLSVEQRSLDALKDQLARLDDIVANGQAQIDALNGQSIGLLSLAQAMAAFQSSITSAQTNPVVAGTSSIAGFYQELLGRAPDQSGLQYWQDALARGNGLDAIYSGIKESAEYKAHQRMLGIPGFANGGDFAGGIRAVGERGIEIEATGASRIHSTQAIINALRNPSNANEALVTALRALQEEVKQLRETNSAENRAIAKGAQQTAEHLDAAINGDTPLATKVIA